MTRSSVKPGPSGWILLTTLPYLRKTPEFKIFRNKISNNTRDHKNLLGKWEIVVKSLISSYLLNHEAHVRWDVEVIASVISKSSRMKQIEK